MCCSSIAANPIVFSSVAAMPELRASSATASATAGRDVAVEDRRDDVVLAQLHVLHDPRDRARGGHLHLLGDLLGADVERAAEDAREAEDVVDLVGVVRAAGRHDAHALGPAVLGRHLGRRVRHREDERVRVHQPPAIPGGSRPGPLRPMNRSMPSSSSLGSPSRRSRVGRLGVPALHRGHRAVEVVGALACGSRRASRSR